MEQIFYNGNVITMDPHRPRAEAFLVRDGNFAALGSVEELGSVAADPQMTDLELSLIHI